MSEEDTSKQNVTTFLDKLYSILEEESPSIISWSSSGDSFIIHSPQLFSQNVMGKYFKSNKFNSFVRQLNFYGFRKSTRDQSGEDRSQGNKTWEFRHPQFIRGRKDLIAKIHRKQIGDSDTDLEARILQLENESHYLYNIVNELLIWKRDICTRYPSLATESVLDTRKQSQLDYMSQGKVDPLSLYENSMKSWPQSLVSSSLTYTSSPPPLMSVGNAHSISSDTIQPLKSTQGTYVNSSMLPVQHSDSISSDSTNLPIFITKRPKQVPTKTDSQSSSTRNRTEESQIVFPRSDTVPSVTTPSDSSISNTPLTIYSKDFFPPQGYL